MRIKSVKISRFRSIKEAYFELNKVTAIVGENNAGKTTILKAINSVLNFEEERQYFENKINQFKVRTNSKIIITFEDIPNKSIYQNKTHNGMLSIEFVYTYSKNKYKYQCILDNGVDSIDDSFMSKLRDDIAFVYIQTNRTNNDIEWSEKSIIKELITNQANQYRSGKDHISTHIKDATKLIHKSILEPIENNINKLYLQNKTINFEIEFKNDIDFTILLDKINVNIKGKESSFPLEEWGSGTKSLAIIAMYRAYALSQHKNIILGIEEPETNLHPQAQKRFIYSLKNNLSDEEIQVLFTTHSTVLINELSHEDILLVRRNCDANRGFISQVKQLPKDFWEKYNIVDFKHYQFFGYKNSDFFFSKFVVIGESKNDCQVFEYLVQDELKDKIADISFLNADGISNLKFPYFLLTELGIPFVMVVDRDYFFEYKNKLLEKSRNKKTGLPEYSDKIKNDDIIKYIFNTNILKKELIELNKRGYRKFFQYISKYNILCMNYSLEIDLTSSQYALNYYYNYYKLKPYEKTRENILVNYSKSLKSLDKILEILSKISKRSYPESYKKIKCFIIEKINQNIV